MPKMAYAPFVEFGTKAHFPPIAAITDWANSKGINPYALQKSIGAKGMKAHPFFIPAVEEGTPKIQEYFRVALAKIPPFK